MKALKQLFSGILLLLALAFSVALIFVALKVITQSDMQTLLNVFYSVPANAWLLALIGAAILAMSLVVIFGRADKQKEAEKRAATATALIRASDIGATYIAVSAIDTMVQKNVRSNNRIKDCYSRVVSDGNGIAIHLRLALMPDTNVVELTEATQTALKEYIESLTGIIVREIHILIDSVSNNAAGTSIARVN